MQPFDVLTGTVAPLLVDDVNTDQIAPALVDFRPDYAAMLFSRRRRRADGSDDPDFVLNKPPFRTARILLAGANFGCGSSRESAVWALAGFGIRCVVARSFADIFHDNCLKNGVLPIVLAPADAAAFEADVLAVDGREPYTVDLRRQRIARAGAPEIPFTIDPAERDALLEGLDDIGLTLEQSAAIAAWEVRMRHDEPWVQTLAAGRLSVPAHLQS